MKPAIKPGQLVSAQGLLDAVFPQDKRPKLRWLRVQQERRTIPFVKIGRFVFFNPDEVRKALFERHTIRAK